MQVCHVGICLIWPAFSKIIIIYLFCIIIRLVILLLCILYGFIPAVCFIIIIFFNLLFLWNLRHLPKVLLFPDTNIPHIKRPKQ